MLAHRNPFATPGRPPPPRQPDEDVKSSVLEGGSKYVKGISCRAARAISDFGRDQQAGVGSAQNDTVRQIGGALGVGIFGSILSSIYSSSISDAVTSLGEGAAAAASNSIGAALQVAGSLTGGTAGEELALASRQSFMIIDFCMSHKMDKCGHVSILAVATRNHG